MREALAHDFHRAVLRCRIHCRDGLCRPGFNGDERAGQQSIAGIVGLAVVELDGGTGVAVL